MRRTYTNVLDHKELILERLGEGKTQREIAQELGFKDKSVIKEFLKRQRRRGAALRTDLLPDVHGRKVPSSFQECLCENKRLKMENELLRDFLRIAGRR